MAKLKIKITVDPEFQRALDAAVASLAALNAVIAHGDWIRTEVVDG